MGFALNGTGKADAAAETAQAAAEAAQTAAETAQSTAEAAQTAADTAQSTAETAQEAAETAQETADGIAQSLAMESSLLAATHGLQRDGKIYGVKFPVASYSSAAAGERTEDAVGMTAEVSTDTVAGTNDFDSVPIFDFVRVNGYLNSSYNFVETAVEGDRNFARDGSNGDVYCRFQLRFFRYITTDENYEELQITDTYRANEGWCPYSAFLNADGSLKPYLYVAAYDAGYGSDGKAASISGVASITDMSHNSQITLMKAKGTQYCGMTEKEISVLVDMFAIEFATRNSQNIMMGCTDYNYQYPCAVAESGVERVILTETNAAYYEVGSTVSLSASGLSAAPDRANTNAHSTAKRKVITSKEPVTIDDTDYVALNLDNGGTTFSTATTMYVSTMDWHTGECDGVLGSSGSPTSNTSGRFPMMYRGVENFYGNLWTTISDTVVSAYVPYVCYDNTKFTSSAPTSDYEALDYKVATTSTSYIKTLGYDSAHPHVRYPTAVSGSSSTYYCDYWYIASGVRGMVFGGRLSSGSFAGAWARSAYGALSYSYWARSARLSTCGLCGKAA